MFKDEDDDDNPFDKNGILKDGRTVRISLMDAMRARGQLPDEPDDDEPEDDDVEDSVSHAFAMQDARPGGPWVVDARIH